VPRQGERLLYCDHVEADGEGLFRLACEHPDYLMPRTGVLHITARLPTLRHGLSGAAERVPMPLRESVGNAEKRRLPMHAKGMLSFTVTVLLCLPSLVAGAALLVNLLLYRNIEQWTQISSALIALGIFFGNSAALLAAVVCAIAALRRRVSVKLKYAHLVVLAFLCRRTGLRP